MFQSLRYSAAALLCGLSLAAHAAADVPALKSAIDSSERPAALKARDPYRHPLQTLEFFGIAPNMHVVEIWPGLTGYTDILAPYLREHGEYIAALPASEKGLAAYKQKLADSADLDKVTISTFAPPAKTEVAPPGSADAVLTFRNVHNWISGGYDQAAFNAFYTALKPGGTLGVVEHRAKPGSTLETMKKSGYVNEDYVIALAENAGFKLVARSKINDNPKDDKDHPAGVWTLPPTLKLGDQDRDKYLAIGESDRMTLKFVKPKGADH
ncbi:class I SAM-dependent methyltransferase [Solimonas marina]|uniref:Class I SAM-dependent methyltransferase n=1 Tax=Solimonas marina TaxID=2714601 RepID=A0A969W7V1_9GAMM|nr:class I SAM-dependent methyltransferase [Solimonas marina]NKF21509.1 class I SAM-dependent methyltransferase [Solimonas marina]